MGLTMGSTGARAIDQGLRIEKINAEDRVIALAGNPNVGKSTVFNALTGLNQHTGNWPGKTVATAQGSFMHQGRRYILVDLPGCYSLMAHSAEEEVARDFICFGDPDVTVVVCDATCLERNLNLILQTLERTRRVIVCVNLMDEAKKKHIRVDVEALSAALGVPVIPTSARSSRGLAQLTDTVSALCAIPPSLEPGRVLVTYADAVESAIQIVAAAVAKELPAGLSPRWAALRLLDGEDDLVKALSLYLKKPILGQSEVCEAIKAAKATLAGAGFTAQTLKDSLVGDIYRAAEAIYRSAVHNEDAAYNKRQLKIDRVLTSRKTGVPLMLLMLMGVFYLTITGANYPSALLAKGLFWVQDQLTLLFTNLGAPAWLHGMLVLGAYRVLAWVVSVMLPPMAIFFPLFTLLEDLGYLPRVAFNLDRHFKKCCACGKQALTMCMVDNGMRKKATPPGGRRNWVDRWED